MIGSGGGTVPKAAHKYATQKSMTALWDLSKDPQDNSDRVKKLGKADATHAAAIQSFDSEALALTLCDGIHSETDITSIRRFEPDNWMLRLHSEKGRKYDAAWALRIPIDDVHRDDERTNRSLMFIDQCDKQNWAWARDLFKVKRLGATCKHEELRIDSAGFLAQLRSATATGEITRAALMLNISRRGGYVTDGKRSAQAHHAWYIGPNSSSGTVADPQGADTCGGTKLGKLGLRGDVEYRFGNKWAHLAMGGAHYTWGTKYSGKHWIFTPAPVGPSTEMSDEADVSNQTVIPNSTGEGLWVYVEIPDLPGVPTRPGMAVPSTFPSVPAGVTTPTAGSVGAFTTADYTASANACGTHHVIPIPEQLPKNLKLTHEVEFLTPAAGIGGRGIGLSLDYCVIGNGDSGAPGARTGQLTASLTAATYSGNSTLYRVTFEIPRGDLVGSEGGKVAFAFYRDADALGDTLHVVNNGTFYAQEVTP